MIISFKIPYTRLQLRCIILRNGTIMWIYFASFLAYFVKGICGFANTLVFQSLMSYQMNSVQITPLDLLVGYPSNFLLAFTHRKHIDLKIVFFFTLCVFIGILPSIFLLKNIDARFLKIGFGILMIYLGVTMLSNHQQKSSSRAKNIIMSLLSGCITGLFGVGALLGVFVQQQSKNAQAFKANLCSIFFFENTFRIILYSLTGILHLALFKQAIFLLPFSLLGLYSGVIVSHYFKEKTSRKIILSMIIISGIVLILHQL